MFKLQSYVGGREGVYRYGNTLYNDTSHTDVNTLTRSPHFPLVKIAQYKNQSETPVLVNVALHVNWIINA